MRVSSILHMYTFTSPRNRRPTPIHYRPSCVFMWFNLCHNQEKLEAVMNLKMVLDDRLISWSGRDDAHSFQNTFVRLSYTYFLAG